MIHIFLITRDPASAVGNEPLHVRAARALQGVAAPKTEDEFLHTHGLRFHAAQTEAGLAWNLLDGTGKPTHWHYVRDIEEVAPAPSPVAPKPVLTVFRAGDGSIRVRSSVAQSNTFWDSLNGKTVEVVPPDAVDVRLQLSWAERDRDLAESRIKDLELALSMSRESNNAHCDQLEELRAVLYNIRAALGVPNETDHRKVVDCAEAVEHGRRRAYSLYAAAIADHNSRVDELNRFRQAAGLAGYPHLRVVPLTHIPVPAP